MVRIRQWLPALVISLLTSGSVYFLVQQSQKKIAVVDAVKLFNSFTMKKEMETEAGGRLSFYEHKLDSISMQLQAAKNSAEPAEHLLQNYEQLKAMLDNEYASSNQAINEAVWKRLNPIIDGYGKEKGYHLIIGANGMGSVLYNDNYYDITDQVISHANKVYEGNR